MVSTNKKFSSQLQRFPHFNNIDSIHDETELSESLLDSLPNYPKDDKHKLDIVIENQRGMKIFGIPLFSNNSLLPILDPSNFQLLNGGNIKLCYGNLINYPLPDIDWEWAWPKWYVLMLDDVDDEGWIYSKMFFSNHHWKGKYYPGNFVRRRIWIRMRQKKE